VRSGSAAAVPAPRTLDRFAGHRRAVRGLSPAAAAVVVLLGVFALGGMIPTAAAARDLLILRGEVRRGELVSCDAVACRLDQATIPRSTIVLIGLGNPPLPAPPIRNPLQDEIHLRDGSSHTGPFVSLDARRVITSAREYARREVRWIYLAPAPVASGSGSGSAGRTDNADDGSCGFWVGTLRQRVEISRRTTENQLRRTIWTDYAARFKETSSSGPGTTTIGGRQIQATTVLLRLDEGSVRERTRGTLSGIGGNRVAGSGAGGIGDRVGGGDMVTEVPAGRTYYQIGLVGADFKYPVTVRWNSGPTERSDHAVMNVDVGSSSDPEQPRAMAPGSRVMKGEYVVAVPESDHIVERTVAWDLSRVTTPCNAPPGVPSLPSADPSSDTEEQ
jgi:hypothetical protein